MSRSRRWQAQVQRERGVDDSHNLPRLRGREGPPTVIYTVMADYGGAWAWMKPTFHHCREVGACVGSRAGWCGRHRLPRSLVLALCDWQDWFDRHVPVGMDTSEFRQWPWRVFHQEGRALCQRLKQFLGEAAAVRYARPVEDPFWLDEPEVEFQEDGSFQRVEAVCIHHP